MALRSFVASKKLMIKKELAEYYLFQKKGGGNAYRRMCWRRPKRGSGQKTLQIYD